MDPCPIYIEVSETLNVRPLAMKERNHGQFMRERNHDRWLADVMVGQGPVATRTRKQQPRQRKRKARR